MTVNLEKKDQKINVFINNHPEWGGTFQYTQLIIRALEKKFSDQQINFYYTNKIWDKELNKNHYFINLGFIQIIIIQFLILFNFISFPKIFVKYLLPSLPDTFFENNQFWIFPSQDIISIICKGKTIVSINDLMHKYSNFTETSFFFRKFYRDYKFKKIAKHSYRVLVDSNLGKKHVEDTYGKFDNIRVQYFSALKDKSEISQNYHGKYLIYPAQYWSHKNHIKLLFAIKILKQKFSDIKLILIGHKKKKFSEINKLVLKLDLEKNVIFEGFVSDKKKASLISNARALVNPSFLGPTNIPQLEAFNYDCPVIVSNVFATKEQCLNNVVYFNPHYEESIAKSIEKIWGSNDFYSLYKKKSSEIKKKYSFQSFSENLIKNIF